MMAIVMSHRILIAEFAHETNRFSMRPTGLQSFRERRLIEGREVIETLRGTNSEIAGFIAQGEREAWHLVPTISAACSLVMFSSCPVVAFVEGVKSGCSSAAHSSRPLGRPRRRTATES